MTGSKPSKFSALIRNADFFTLVKFVFDRVFCGVWSIFIARKHSFPKKFYVKYPDRLEGLNYARIGANFRSELGVWIQCIDFYGGIRFRPQLIIGENCALSRFCHIGCAGNITIGDNVLIGSNVLITDHGHGDYSTLHRDKTVKIPPVSRPLKVNTVRIGSNVWIGDGAMILPGANIGDNVVVGAGTIVFGIIEAGKVVVGPRTSVVI